MASRFLLKFFRLDWLQSALLPLLLIGCALLSWHPLSGNSDVWAHANVGRWIVTHGQLPRETLHLWTASIPWVYHSWGAQVWFYALLQAGGDYGPALLLGFTMLMAGASFAVLWLLWRRRARPDGLAALLFAVAIGCSWPRFFPRPELFSGFFCALLLAVLIVRPQRGMWAIVALFVAWANVHGAVAFGLLIFAACVLGDALQDVAGQRRLTPPTRRLVLLFVLSVLAVNLNPYGWKLWGALRPVASYTFSTIQEWKPFWVNPFLPREYVAGEAVLCLFALAAWMLGRRKRWTELLWILTAAGLFLSARRYLWLSPLVFLAVMAANAEAFTLAHWQERFGSKAPRRIGEAWPWFSRAATLGALGWFLFQSWPNMEGEALRATEASLPVEPAGWLKNAPRPIFNDYEYSSYLQWALNGQPELFIDLLNAYPDSLMHDYEAIRDATPHGIELLDRYRIQTVYLRPHGPSSGLAPLSLFLDANWQRVYWWQDGAIWVRPAPGFKPLPRLEIPALLPEQPEPQ